MRLRGRRHWTEIISVYKMGAAGGFGSAPSLTLLHDDIQASVQPASNAVALRHGITAGRPIYWVRFAESAPSESAYVEWRNDYYDILELSEGNDIDVELLIAKTVSPPPVVTP